MKKQAISKTEKYEMTDNLWEFQKKLEDTIDVIEEKKFELKKQILVDCPVDKQELVTLLAVQEGLFELENKYRKVLKELSDLRHDIEWLNLVEQ